MLAGLGIDVSQIGSLVCANLSELRMYAESYCAHLSVCLSVCHWVCLQQDFIIHLEKN